MKVRRRLLVALAVLGLSLATYPGADLVSLAVRLTPPPTAAAVPAGPLPWLHVGHPAGRTPFISDERGGLVLLHGAIPGGLIDFWSGTDPSIVSPAPFYPIDPAAYEGRCPANSATIRVPPLCETDLTEMAALGFNSMRLPLSWSLLEPARGEFSVRYLDRVAQVIGWARAKGIYVILDMHQNAYSRYVGRSSQPPAGGALAGLDDYTGAPAWATLTDGLPSETFLGKREVNPAVLAADTNFWYNTAGIQSEYIRAVAFLARRFKNDSTVAGYSIFNEPWPGLSLPPDFDDLLLFPFYRRLIDALVGTHDGLPCPTSVFMPAVCGYPDLGVHDRHHLMFLDPGLLREITDFPTHLGLPLSSYPNLVLGIHSYTHQFTIDAILGQAPDQATYPWGGLDQSYSLAEKEARALGAALFVSEFESGPRYDALLTAGQLREQEKHRLGFAFWTWKENCGGSWGMYAPIPGGCAYGRAAKAGDGDPKPPNGCLRAPREALLARPYPRLAPDDGFTFAYDHTSGAFSIRGAARHDNTRALVIYIPAEVTGRVTGGTAQTAADGSRTITLTPRGDYSLAIGAAPLHLFGC